jgi:hypothetical protein
LINNAVGRWQVSLHRKFKVRWSKLERNINIINQLVALLFVCGTVRKLRGMPLISPFFKDETFPTERSVGKPVVVFSLLIATVIGRGHQYSVVPPPPKTMLSSSFDCVFKWKGMNVKG